AARAAASYDWLMFTSANAVDALWDRLEHLGLPTRLPGKIAVIGPATARAVERHGQPVDFMAPQGMAESLATGLADLAGQRILWPRAETARELLAVSLRLGHAIVDEVVAYRNQPADPAAQAEIIAELRRGIDVVTLTSASTATSFAVLLEKFSLPVPPVVACIGKETARVAVIKGLPVQVIADVHTSDGLVAAIEKYFSVEVSG
ncbi:MAG: uroporphyrinogen-III synthase, partial [Anaerolineales bacterium]